MDELSPQIKRWLYLATTFSAIAAPFLSYGMIGFGVLVLVCVFVKAYKSFVFNRDTIELIELGRKSLRRGSHLIANSPHRLMVARESYTLLTSSPSTGQRLANCHKDEDEQGLMLGS